MNFPSSNSDINMVIGNNITKSLGYTFKFKNKTSLEIFAGVNNILDQFQNDVDIGEERDAGYVYGPSNPFTIFVGANYKIGGKK